MKLFKLLRQQRLIIRLFRWEHWPFHVVYLPIYFYWLWLCVKSRSFFFFNTSNPSIKNGGFLMESKKEIYDLLPKSYYPSTLLFKYGTSIDIITHQVATQNLQFPLIGKPDIGRRGMGVQQLKDIAAVITYARSSKVDFLLQEFVPFKNEVGIFYYRYPDEMKGHISGIVKKEFLTVKGDGSLTIRALLMKNPRFILQLPSLEQEYGDKLNTVPVTDEEVLLVPYGNHCRGAKFLDVSYLIDEELIRTFDKVCSQVKGFYFGRLDIRYNTWKELKQGKFSIIELNGAGSEPAHIYDPQHSLIFAWKEIIRHLDIMYKICRKNHSAKGVPYMKLKHGFEMLRENSAYLKKISMM